MDAFTEAGTYWSSNFSDDITLNVDGGYDALATVLLLERLILSGSQSTK